MNPGRILVTLLLVGAIFSASGWHNWPAGWIALFLALRVADDFFVNEAPKAKGMIHRAAQANVGWIGALISAAALIVSMFTSSLPTWVISSYGFAAAWILVPPFFVGMIFLLVGMAGQFSSSRVHRTDSGKKEPGPYAIAMPDAPSGEKGANTTN